MADRLGTQIGPVGFGVAWGAAFVFCGGSPDTFGRKPPSVPLDSVLQNSLARHFFAILEEMSKRSALGEFELMILLSLIRLGDEAYGVPISKELLRATGREVALGSVYAALDRLEKKGFVASTLGDPTPARGGRAKRYFRATKTGMREAQTTRTALMNLWRGLPLAQGEHP